jgi:hypothetical protein
VPDDPTLFDEWHLHWTLDPTGDHVNTDTFDADRLHAELNAPAVQSAVELAVREVVRQVPVLHPLNVSVTK